MGGQFQFYPASIRIMICLRPKFTFICLCKYDANSDQCSRLFFIRNPIKPCLLVRRDIIIIYDISVHNNITQFISYKLRYIMTCWNIGRYILVLGVIIKYKKIFILSMYLFYLFCRFGSIYLIYDIPEKFVLRYEIAVIFSTPSSIMSFNRSMAENICSHSRTFSLSRVQSRTGSSYAEAQKRFANANVLLNCVEKNASIVRTLVVFISHLNKKQNMIPFQKKKNVC